MADPRKSIPTVRNFRDVAATVNASTNKDLLVVGKLYRSARPDGASADDRRKLKDVYGIKTIIDLRTSTELIQQAKKRKANVKASAAVPKTDDSIAEPVKIPGVEYREINFNGSAYSKSLISKLTWGQTGKLVGLMAFGYRTEAISILGINVMRERGLVGLALDSIDVCTKEVCEVFQVLAEPRNYPLMIHCTQGKDRTGLIVQLVLLLLGVPLKAVAQDYMMSEPELEPEKADRMQEIQSIGLTEEFACCSPEMAEQVQRHIGEKYGSVEQYLTNAGVTAEMQQSVRRILKQEDA